MAIAMTFDDGPGGITTPKLLDLLAELDVQVTFFVLGRMVKQNPGVLRRISAAQQRHELCNHSWSHTSFKQLSDDKIRAEIEDTQKVIADTVGNGKASKIVRPPYGAVKQRQREFISRELGYKVVGWNVDPQDWKKGKTSKQIAQHILTHTRDGQVVLAHDIHQRTIDAMPDTLRTLKKKYGLLSLSRLGNFTTDALAWATEYAWDGFC